VQAEEFTAPATFNYSVNYEIIAVPIRNQVTATVKK